MVPHRSPFSKGVRFIARAGVVGAAVALTGWSRNAVGATYYWDPVGGDRILSGGSGIWSTSIANWTTSSTGTGSNVSWPAATGNASNFGGPDAPSGQNYSVQLPGIVNGEIVTPASVNVDSITFAADGYVISSDTPLTKLISTATSSITGTTGKTLTIGSNIIVQRGSSTTTINGGTLVFDTGSAFTANGNISYGSSQTSILKVNTGASFTTTGNFTDTFGQVIVAGTFSVNQLTLGPNAESGGVAFQPFTLNEGALVTAANGVFMGGSGQNSRGRLTLNGGTLVTPGFTKGTNGSAAAIITFNGGAIRASTNNANFFGSGSTLVSGSSIMEGGAIIDSAGFNIGIGRPLTSGISTDGGFAKKGAGILTLSAVSTYKGATHIEGGTISLTATTASALPASDLELSGGAVLDLMGAADSFSSTTVKAVNLVDGTIQSSGGAATLTGTSFQVTKGVVNVALAGATASLTKTGSGLVELNAINSYEGTTSVQGGTLKVSGTAAIFSSSGIAVASGAKLTGAGYLNGITLGAGALLAPGDDGLGVMKAASLLWNSNNTGSLMFTLSNTDNTSVRLSLELGGTGNFFNKGLGNAYVFDFQNTGFYDSNNPTVYTLITFESTNFNVGDFSYVNLAGGLDGSFVLNSNNLQFIVVPEPATWTMLAGGLAVLTLVCRRRRRIRS